MAIDSDLKDDEKLGRKPHQLQQVLVVVGAAELQAQNLGRLEVRQSARQYFQESGLLLEALQVGLY